MSGDLEQLTHGAAPSRGGDHGHDHDHAHDRRSTALKGTKGAGYDAQARALTPDAGTLAPKTGAEATAPAAPAPKGGAGTTKTLPAGALVLSRSPKYAKSSYVSWFSDQINAKIQGWGLPYAASAVYLADDKGTKVIGLDWNAAWGSKPATKAIDLGMRPVDAKAALTAVKSLAGWAKVPGGEQATLTGLLGGETNDSSEAARGHLRPKYAGLKAKTAEQQASALQAAISAKDAKPGVVSEQVETKAITYTLSAATVKKDYAFRGKVADAESYTATFSDGASIEIVAPKAPEAGFHYHTVAQCADAAAYLPAKSRKVVNTILLNVVTNPDDPGWAVKYKRPNFHSYMTAGDAGRVTIYPSEPASKLPDDNYRRGTMIHETGHTWSYKTWGTDKTKGGWARWRTAMTADKTSVSGYADASIAEDVAETIQIYGSTKGAPKYAEYKAIVPNRLAILEKEMG